MAPISIKVKAAALRGFPETVFEMDDTSTVKDLRTRIAEAVGCKPEGIKMVLAASILSNDLLPLSSFPAITRNPVNFVVPSGHVYRPKGESQNAAAPASLLEGTDENHQTASANAPQSAADSQADRSVPESAPLATENYPAAAPAAAQEPSAENIATLRGIFNCSENDARIALRISNNNSEIAAELLSTGQPMEQLEAIANNPDLQRRLQAQARATGPMPVLTNEQLEQIIAQQPEVVEGFTRKVASVSPNLALRFNEDRELMLDTLRLFLAMNMEFGALAEGLAATNNDSARRGSDNAGGAPAQAAPPANARPQVVSPEDQDNITTIIAIAGGNLNVEKVTSLYFSVGRNLDATLSIIFDNRQAFE